MCLFTACREDTGLPFTKRADVLPPNLEKSRSREVGYYNSIYIMMIISVWNLTVLSAALLPMCLPNFTAILAIGKSKPESRGFKTSTGSCGKTTCRLVNRGPGDRFMSWWRHQMKTISVLLALCAGNSPVVGEFPSQRPVTRSLCVFFDLRKNKWMNEQPCCRRMRRHRTHYDVTVIVLIYCGYIVSFTLIYIMHLPIFF